jgi:PBP superfamily domain
MRMHKTQATLAIGAALVTGLSLALSGVASADSAARPGDVVGVGSDTLQNGVDFFFDSAPGNTGGYNELGNKNRAFNFFATGDANGRAVYDGTCGTAGTNGLGAFCDSTTKLTPNLLPGSVILRDGSAPVTRPNGSGAGVAALIADAPGGTGFHGLPLGSIQFARMSRLPNAGEESSCTAASACGGLDVFQIATDTLSMAVQSAHPTGNGGNFGGTNAPAAGLSLQELVSIYSCATTGSGPGGALEWKDLPGNSTGSAGVIHPLLPQSGSGTRTFFLADLQAANGGTAVNPGTCVRSVEEHDPTGIYGDPSPADAIEPFSTAKLALINGTASGLSSGYFLNGAGYAGSGALAGDSAYTPGYLTTLPAGTAGDGNPAYAGQSRGVYITIRHVDEASTVPVQPGASQTWAQLYFTGGTIANPTGTLPAPLIKGGTAGGLLAEAGFTQAYKACGTNPTTC